MNPAWLPAACCVLLLGCGGATGKRGPKRDFAGQPGASTAYFAGLWRGVVSPTLPRPDRGKTPQSYVMFNVRLIGEALSDRSHVAAFSETWHRADASVRCRRSGTLKLVDAHLVLRVRENNCVKHWDELERPQVHGATKDTVTLIMPAGTIHYRWLRNAAPD